MNNLLVVVKPQLICCIIVALIFASCNDHDEVFNEEAPSSAVAADTLPMLSLLPVSYDMTDKDVIIDYHTSGASMFEAYYKDMNASEWLPASVEYSDSVTKVTLSGLKEYDYYYVLAVAANDSGHKVTDEMLVQYDYELFSKTIFTKPFLSWGSELANVKDAMKGDGYKLNGQTTTDDGFRLEYRFRYKEQRSEYLFDAEQKLREVLVWIDDERTTDEELRRFLVKAHGYEACGNVKVSSDGKVQVAPLFETEDQKSYAFYYKHGRCFIVDFIDVRAIDVSTVIER